MDITLLLDQMTISDKLRVLEEIWADLCRSGEDLPSPAWHADVLLARESRISDGLSRTTDWEDAKARIRRSVE